MIDEVQYAPELFSYIKMEIDKGAAPGTYWFTGSQAFKLMELAQESLAGLASGKFSDRDVFYSNNLLKRTVKTSKMYFFDTGLVAYLTRYSSPEILANGAEQRVCSALFVSPIHPFIKGHRRGNYKLLKN